MQSKNSRPFPLQKLPMHQSPRCGAKTRNGSLCRAPAMKTGRCRMHGGKSTGAPTDNQNARKHGLYSRDAIEERRHIRALINSSKELVEKV